MEGGHDKLCLYECSRASLCGGWLAGSRGLNRSNSGATARLILQDPWANKCLFKSCVFMCVSSFLPNKSSLLLSFGGKHVQPSYSPNQICAAAGKQKIIGLLLNNIVLFQPSRQNVNLLSSPSKTSFTSTILGTPRIIARRFPNKSLCSTIWGTT